MSKTPPNTKANPPPNFLTEVSEVDEENVNKEDTPPKTKSHYFVQKYDLGNGYKKCMNCGKVFHTNRSYQKYCSRECYNEGIKTVKAIWFQKRKEHNLAVMKRYQDSIREVKFGKPNKTLIRRIKFYKCVLIKKKLMEMNLLTLNLLSAERIEELKKVSIKTRRYKVNQEKVDHLIFQLTKIGLYDNYPQYLDFTPPKVDIKEPSIATSLKYQPLITLPESESINQYSFTHKEEPT